MENLGSKPLLVGYAAMPAVSILGILGTYFFDLSDKGVALAGQVEPGLPRLRLPTFQLHNISALAPAALGLLLFLNFRCANAPGVVATPHLSSAFRAISSSSSRRSLLAARKRWMIQKARPDRMIPART